MTLKIALYIGQYRFPLTPSDIGVELLTHMIERRHQIVALLAAPEDPVCALAARNHIPVLPLPEELELPVRKMRAVFQARPLPEACAGWCRALAQIQPDIGVVYCGGWVPETVNRIPRLGFINLHPGPLPEFTGYDPEKFLILNGHREGWGTVHYVADEFDTGDILEFTDPVEVTGEMTTPELAKRISRQGFHAIDRALARIAAGDRGGQTQTESRRGYASRARGWRECRIDWAHDSHRKLDARLRAFNSLDDGMCLRYCRDGQWHAVLGLDLYECAPPGAPGERVGVYPGEGEWRDADVIATVEGVAAVARGAALAAENSPLILPEHLLVKPERRRFRTAWEKIQWCNERVLR